MKKKKKPEIRFRGFIEDWEQRKLGEYCEMFNGDRSSKYPGAQDMVSVGIPFINAGDLEDGHVNLTTANKITREKYDDLGGAKLQLGDIVYCLRGTLGKNAYIDNFTEGTVASSLVAIRPKNIDGRYLFHILNSDIEYRQRVVHDEGAAQPNLSAKSVSEFIIPIPDIDEQEKISSYLDNLSTLITLHQRKLEKLQNFKKSMLEKMFPQNDSKTPQIRFKGFTNDWEQRKLREVAERVQKNDGRMNLPTLTISAGKGWLNQEERFSGNIAGNEQKNYTLLKKGELSYNHGNSKLAKYGAVFELKTYEEALVPKVYHSFRMINENSPVFTEYLFATKLPDKELGKLVSSGARMDGLLNISFDDFFGISLSMPNIQEQKAIGEYFSTLDHLITLHQRKLEKLQNIKKSMLEKMFV